jgi:protein SCO1
MTHYTPIQILRARRFTRLGAITILAALALVLASCREPDLIGTDMERQPAPPFTLTDQREQSVSLADLEGQAVALTFIFTNCPDVCPLIVNRMKTAYEELPERVRDDVALVAITVDPERDTPEVMREYTERQGLGDNANWYALTGDLATLQDIWRAYYVAPGERYPADPSALVPSDDHSHDDHGSEQDDSHDHGDADTDADDGVRTIEDSDTEAYWLAHTDVIYIIDREGRVRVLLRSPDATPETLAHNLEALAK